MTLMCMEAGAHVICMNDVYGGTNSLFKKMSQTLSVSFVDLTDMDAFCAALTPKTRVSRVLLLVCSFVRSLP